MPGARSSSDRQRALGAQESLSSCEILLRGRDTIAFADKHTESRWDVVSALDIGSEPFEVMK
jgi:hypothetical protein